MSNIDGGAVAGRLRMGRSARLTLGGSGSGVYLAVIGAAAVSTFRFVTADDYSGDGLELLYLGLLALPWSLLLPFVVHDPPVAEQGLVALLAVACVANWALVTWWAIRRLGAGTRTPSGWYRDYATRDQARYWDGHAWTESYRPAPREFLGYEVPVLHDPVLWAAGVGWVVSLVGEIVSGQGPLWTALGILLAAGGWFGTGALVGSVRTAIRDSRGTPT